MANPQPDKFVRISRELALAFAKVNMSSYEQRVIWCIMHQTYGYDKKLDRISYSQFEEFTGLDRRHIGRTIKLLQTKNMIVCIGEGYSIDYGIQKDYDQWLNLSRHEPDKPLPIQAIEPLPNEAIPTIAYTGNSEHSQPLPIQVRTIAQTGNESLPKLATTGASSLQKQKKQGGVGGNGGGKNESGVAGDFWEYFEELRAEFSDLDIKTEYKKFQLYWSEGGRKLKRPKLGLRNWLEKAREIKASKQTQRIGADGWPRG